MFSPLIEVCLLTYIFYHINWPKNKKIPISTLIRLSSLISGMAEVIACLAIIPALAKFGRVKIYSGGFILSGILCIIVAAVLWTFGKVIYCQD